MDLPTRLESLNDFRERKTGVMISTDVLTYGIDIPTVELVINFDMPRMADDIYKTYLHRIGRTGRADRIGVALNLVDKDNEIETLRLIEKHYSRDEMIFKINEKDPEVIAEKLTVDNTH